MVSADKVFDFKSECQRAELGRYRLFLGWAGKTRLRATLAKPASTSLAGYAVEFARGRTQFAESDIHEIRSVAAGADAPPEFVEEVE